MNSLMIDYTTESLFFLLVISFFVYLFTLYSLRQQGKRYSSNQLVKIEGVAWAGGDDIMHVCFPTN